MPGAYPDVSVVRARLVDEYRDQIPEAIIAECLEVAIQSFEDATGHVPFLGSTEVTENYVVNVIPGRLLLDLGTSFWRIDSIYDEQDDSTETTYKPYPPNGLDPTQGNGFSAITVSVPATCKSRLLVTGCKGFAKTLPGDVYKVIADRAAVMSFKYLLEGEGALTRLKQGPVEYEWDANADTAKLKQWQNEWNSAVRKYRRNPL